MAFDNPQIEDDYIFDITKIDSAKGNEVIFLQNIITDLDYILKNYKKKKASANNVIKKITENINFFLEYLLNIEYMFKNENYEINRPVEERQQLLYKFNIMHTILEIINYFFRSNINKLVGAGIGSMYWKEEFGYGFMHFGQNDLGPFLLLGGLALIIIILWLFYRCVNAVNKSWIFSLAETVFLIIWMLYTQIFTTSSIMISYILFVLTCGLEKYSSQDDRPSNIKHVKGYL